MKSTLVRSLIFVPAFASIVFAARIATDYDHSVNFERYKTYSWIQAKAGNSLWEDRIMHDVDSQLAGRGWTSSRFGRRYIGCSFRFDA